MPKAHLLSDGGLDFEYSLAERLHTTHRRLMRDLGPKELAYWRAKTEIENERYDHMVEKSKKEAEATRKEQRMRRS
jgi:hypothetical protein